MTDALDYLEKHFAGELAQLEEADQYRTLLKQSYDLLGEIVRRLDTGWQPENLEQVVINFTLLLDDYEQRRLCDLNPPIDEKLLRYVISRLNEMLEQQLFRPVN